MFVLAEQLEAIIRSIDDELLMIEENLESNVEHADSSKIAVNHDKLYKWTKAYENINDTSNLFNFMFSVQLTIMLLIVTAYYTILMYTITTITVKRSQSLTMMLVNVFSMTVFLMALFVISRGGQRIQNSSLQLQQKLCELGLHALDNEKYYKLIKDLLRFVRTRPIRVHVFGTLDVNMSMLPSIVALFTTYSVIALQFNNVL
ncbi:hypothetical protein PYW08_016436 [Mythimna loreyi]|uniref:Uncharacterized protein n=1 Tax=Mythimna loreyi TaxID=667449 RepID=A0ACC2QX94_9NEOP|nr:hypothetical protein PYW08_016436 [Mythimna loreyi]